MGIGDRIRKLREQRGLNRCTLAWLIPCKTISVILWEEGTTTPTKHSLDKLAKYFNVSLDYLINGDES